MALLVRHVVALLVRHVVALLRHMVAMLRHMVAMLRHVATEHSRNQQQLRNTNEDIKVKTDKENYQVVGRRHHCYYLKR